MKTKLLALLLLAGSACFARSHFSFSIGFGGYGYPAYAYPAYSYYLPPPPPAPVVRYVPRYYVRPGYTWIPGYWYPVRHRYSWRAGYWARRPYRGAVWVAPRYHHNRYYVGYWRR